MLDVLSIGSHSSNCCCASKENPYDCASAWSCTITVTLASGVLLAARWPMPPFSAPRRAGASALLAIGRAPQLAARMPQERAQPLLHAVCAARRIPPRASTAPPLPSWGGLGSRKKWEKILRLYGLRGTVTRARAFSCGAMETAMTRVFLQLGAAAWRP